MIYFYCTPYTKTILILLFILWTYFFLAKETHKFFDSFYERNCDFIEKTLNASALK